MSRWKSPDTLHNDEPLGSVAAEADIDGIEGLAHRAPHRTATVVIVAVGIAVLCLVPLFVIVLPRSSTNRSPQAMPPPNLRWCDRDWKRSQLEPHRVLPAPGAGRAYLEVSGVLRGGHLLVPVLAGDARPCPAVVSTVLQVAYKGAYYSYELRGGP
jgi:hypothetical protein